MLSNIEARPAGYWRKNLTVPEPNIAVKTGTSSGSVGNISYPVDNVIVGYTPKIPFSFGQEIPMEHFLEKRVLPLALLDRFGIGLCKNTMKKYPESYVVFEKPEGLEKIQGEWASADYHPPSYAPLTISSFVPELGMNPLLSLSQTRR